MSDEEILNHIYRINKELHRLKESICTIRKDLHDFVEEIKKQNKLK